MAGGFLDRPEHHEVETEAPCLGEFPGIVAGGRDQGKVRASGQGQQLARRQVHAIGAGVIGQRHVAVDQHPGVVAVAEIDRGMDPGGALGSRKTCLAQLHQAQAVIERAGQRLELAVDADLASVADGVEIRQGQRRQYRRVGRQQRRDRDSIRPLPR